VNVLWLLMPIDDTPGVNSFKVNLNDLISKMRVAG